MQHQVITPAPLNQVVSNIPEGASVGVHLNKRVGQNGHFKVVLAGVDENGMPTMVDITFPVASFLGYKYNDSTELLSYNQYGPDIVDRLSRELHGKEGKLKYVRL